MESLWERTWKRTEFTRLEKDIKTDVLIIGGGMARILCAYMLHHAGIPYVLAEAETICSGITKNTTAKITAQHGLIYDKLLRVFGTDRARQYYVDEAQDGMSFRNNKELLFVGGGDHRTGKKGGGWQVLRDFAQKHYPSAAEKYCWATQDCMTLDGVPYIGPYSASTSNLYVATGFNKWGMTSSMVSAMLLCDCIQGKDTPCAEVFSPSRTILRPQLVINGFEAAVHLLTPSTRRCPHLGCALKWNANEHTWDCPCHGSRFTQDGKRIDNPATGDLKK